MDELVRDRLPKDLRHAARVMSEVDDTFPTGQAIMEDAAEEIERLGHVAAGRFRWLSMMMAGSPSCDCLASQAREWADEMDPCLKSTFDAKEG